jgi:hypothetical protein
MVGIGDEVLYFLASTGAIDASDARKLLDQNFTIGGGASASVIGEVDGWGIFFAGT